MVLHLWQYYYGHVLCSMHLCLPPCIVPCSREVEQKIRFMVAPHSNVTLCTHAEVMARTQ